MNRLDFLKYSALGTLSAPSFLNKQLFGKSYPGILPNLIENLITDTDHVLVIVRLQGGNDGLNTVIPLDSYSRLQVVRPNVVVPESTILPLNGVDDVGLHPALSEIQQMYNDGQVAIIQSVGYPNPNFSHFRSEDIWMSGSDADELFSSGWIGRYLNYEYPNFPEGYPNNEMPDPLSIEIGSTLSLAFQGPFTGMGVSISNPADYNRLVLGIQTPSPNTPAGEHLDYVRNIAFQSNQYGEAIKNAHDRGTNMVSYPDNDLANQLGIVARLISGGLKTRVYMVTIDGFDTHDNQVERTDHTQGEHAELLRMLSSGISTFMEDLSRLGLKERVMGMTMSEFGRRIISNESYGTDHGAAAPMFIFGTNVNPGVYGDNPIIPLNANVTSNLPMQYDFRSVYTTFLRDWFCIPDTDLDSIMLHTLQPMDFIDSDNCISTSSHEINQAAGKSVLDCYPNPFTESTNITFETEAGITMIQIFNTAGQLVATPINRTYEKGTFKVQWNSENLPAGTYYVRFQNGYRQQVKPILKVR